MSDEFRIPLQSVCSAVPGAVAATLMGRDGIPVETVAADAADVDVEALLVEYASLLDQIGKSAQMFAAGELRELSIRSDNLTTIFRPLTDDYFVALALRPDASMGKGRYLLRLNAHRLTAALA